MHDSNYLPVSCCEITIRRCRSGLFLNVSNPGKSHVKRSGDLRGKICNPGQSSPSQTIYVPLLSVIIFLVFLYLSKLLFSGFLQFIGNCVHGQKTLKMQWRSVTERASIMSQRICGPKSKWHTIISALKELFCKIYRADFGARPKDFSRPMAFKTHLWNSNITKLMKVWLLNSDLGCAIFYRLLHATYKWYR